MATDRSVADVTYNAAHGAEYIDARNQRWRVTLERRAPSDIRGRVSLVRAEPMTDGWIPASAVDCGVVVPGLRAVAK